MIGSTRRKTAKANIPGDIAPIVLIESNDIVFAEKIGDTINQWGFRHRLFGTETESREDDADVVLLDIRDLSDDAFGHLRAIRLRHPGVEVVLVNRPDNVAASIAGMKAGAVDEVIAPFDTGALKTIITDAFKRKQTARAKKIRKPLLTRFSEAMMAATFAQAGDFEGALELLDGPVPRLTNKNSSNKNNSGT